MPGKGDVHFFYEQSQREAKHADSGLYHSHPFTFFPTFNSIYLQFYKSPVTMPRSRRLAAIMFTDIKGYTALMQQDEARAIQAREKHRRLFNEITARRRGRILQYYGDGTLSIFASAIDAVHCGIETLLTPLVNEISRLPEPGLLVLDDYHLVDAPAVDRALTFLIEHLPRSLHLVITTREDPPLPLPRLRVRGQMTEIRAKDLRFTPAEARELLNQNMGLDLSEAAITALEARTEGWIAGLQLAAISLRGGRDAERFVQSFTGSHRYVLDYLMEEVLLQQAAERREFLLATAILDRLCGPLCEAVLEQPPGSGQSTLAYLEQANLFVVPLDDQRRWYRYHHLFGEVLRARLREEHPALIPALHQRASNWFADNGLPTEAIHHALAAEDFPRAAELMEVVWPAMDGNFQTGAWLRWAERLPAELIRHRPVLSVTYAWALLNVGKLDAAEARLRDAEPWLSKTPPAGMIVIDQDQFQHLEASVATARAYHAQARGDIDGSVHYARTALDRLPPDDHIRRGPAAALLGIAEWANGSLEAAHRSLSEALDNFRLAGQLVFALSGAYGLAYIRIAQGRLNDAVATYEQARRLAEPPGAPPLRGITDIYLGFCDCALERGDREAAAEHLRQSEILGASAALPDWPHRLRRTKARLMEMQGDLGRALALLDEAEHLYYPTPMPDVQPIGARKARIWLAQGNLAQAQNWVRRQQLTPDGALPFLQEYENLTLARVLLADNALPQAASLLDRLHQAAEAGRRMGSLIEILILQAVARQADGGLPAALAPLERALALAAPEGYIRLFIEAGEPARQMLAAAGARGIHPEFVEKVLAAWPTQASSETKPAAPLQSLVEPLSPRELEILDLIARGCSNREIGERLFLALSTVKGHNRNIFDKLGVQRRTEAVAHARKLGLLGG